MHTFISRWTVRRALAVVILLLFPMLVRPSLSNIANLSLLHRIVSPIFSVTISSCMIIAPTALQAASADVKQILELTSIEQMMSESIERNLGTLALVGGDFEQAKMRFDDVLTIQPNDAVSHMRLSQILTAQAQFVAAASELEKIDYVTVTQLADQGFILVNQHELKSALICFEVGTALDPSNAMVRIGKGRVLALEGHPEAALIELNNAVQLCPECAQGFLYRGFVQLALKQANENVEVDFERALTLEPNSFETQYAWANWLAYVGRVTDSERYYQRVIEMYPDILEPYLTLFQLYKATNRDFNATDVLAKAVQRFPAAPELEQVLKEIK